MLDKGKRVTRRKAAITVLAVLASGSMVPSWLRAANTTFTYSPSDTSTSLAPDEWSVGTGWNAIPVGSATTELQFNTGTLGSGSTAFSNNDEPGNFLLNALDLTGAGPSANGATLTISGNPLEFTGTAPSINISALKGAGTLTYAVSNNLVFDSATTIQGAGTGTFLFSGVLSGAGNLTKSGSNSTATIEGNNEFTYGGAITINQGTLAFSSPASANTSSILSLGSITVNNGGTLGLNSPNAVNNGIAFSTLLGNGALFSSGGGGRLVTVDYNGGTTDTFSGTVGTSISKDGVGVLSLSNAGGVSITATSTAGVVRLDGGTLTFAGAFTGNAYLLFNYGTFRVTSASGAALATVGSSASIANAGTRIEVAPTGSSTGTVSLTGLTASSASLRDFGETLALDRGTNAALTLTLGNVATTAAPTVSIGPQNGLIIQPLATGSGVAAGSALSMLGSFDKLISLEGTLTANQANDATVVTNGMVDAGVIGQNNDANLSGAFLTYGSSNGFTPAGASDTNFTTPVATSREVVNTTVSLTSNTNVYSLENDGVLNLNSGVTLTVGANAAATRAGLILNGATIAPASGTAILAFGASEGVVYASAGNGTIGTNITSSRSAAQSALTVQGPGTLFLSGTNSGLGGITTISGSTLDASGTAIPAGPIELKNGVFQSSGTYAAKLGTSAGSISFLNASGVGYGGGGFAARGSQLTVDIGGASTPTPLQWQSLFNDIVTGAGATTGTTNFIPDGLPMLLGSTTADNLVDFQNPVDLGSTTLHYSRIFNVAKNPTPGVATDIAQLSGVISSVSAYNQLVKSGLGTLRLTNADTYSGATFVNAGTLAVDSTVTNTGANAGAVGNAALVNTSGVTLTQAGATFKLVSASTTPNLLDDAATVSTLTGATIELDLNDKQETIFALNIDGSALPPGVYGSSTYFTTNTPQGVASTYEGDFTGDGAFNVTGAVPEPSSMALLALGGIGSLRRRRNRRIDA